jgi:adenylate cyclase class 2
VRAAEKMSIKVQSKVEKMVELKAKVHAIELVRRKLAILGACHIGTFRQIDVYFDVPEGRLKLREVEGDSNAKLIYYERENIANPKKDYVFSLEIQDPEFFKNRLMRLLKRSVAVEKVREIYRFQETQIHLDMVEKLGNFVEFERSSPTEEAVEKNRQIFKKLMRELGINPENLEKLSYSDLIRE